MDSPSQRSRASAGSKKLPQDDCDSAHPKSLPDRLAEDLCPDQTQDHSRSPCKGGKNRLKDAYDGVITSKELLRVMGRTCHIEQQSSTTVSVFSALKLELDRACSSIGKLILDRRSNQSDIEILLKHFEKEKTMWKLKEQERTRSMVKSVSEELEIEKKLRRQTERLNKKLGRELAETKSALLKTSTDLENEKRTREILEQVCDELARGIGDDRAEVEELTKQFVKVQEEIEKEREMLQLADVLREERVQMKLSDAKNQFEEKHALVDKLRNELESYLKSKRGNEEPDSMAGSPRYDKIKELQAYLRETLPGSYQYKKEDVSIGNEDIIEATAADGEYLVDDTEVHSIELNRDGTYKHYQWSDKINGRIMKPSISSGASYTNGVEWEVGSDMDHRRLFGFGSLKSWKKDDVDDEIQRYNMIKDLRDHIVSGKGLSRENSDENFGQHSVASKDPNEVTCHG